MSRSGYIEELDYWELIRWRGAVTSALRGRRGQAFLRELITALDALPMPQLIAEELIQKGAVCALGSVGQQRGLDMRQLDPEDYDDVAGVLNLPPALVREVTYENDQQGGPHETAKERWRRMRNWAVSWLRERGVEDSRGIA